MSIADEAKQVEKIVEDLRAENAALKNQVISDEALLEKFVEYFEVNEWTTESGFSDPLNFYIHEVWKRNPVVTALKKQVENLSQKVTEFDKVIREVCTELHLCYGGVDFDEGEIVQAVIALKATVGSLKEQLTLNNIEYLKTKEEIDAETK